jgi:hypothetical protein
MTLPFPVPDWLPWWVPLAVLVPVLLYLLLFLAMPFSVFGLKARLDLLEARLDEIQGELRRIGTRPPDTINYAGLETPPAFGRSGPAVPRPPIRPARPAQEPFDRAPPSLDSPPPMRPEPLSPPPRLTPEDTPRRVEPRLDWPRQ